MIVRLQGGLGNQMFQAAFGIARSERKQEQLFLHPYHLGKGSHRPYALSVFNYPFQLLRNEDIDDAITYDEESFAFDEEAECQPSHTYFIGNWQSEKYFSSHANQIRALFTLHKFLTPATQQWLYRIKINQPTTCAIHVRRTDYLNVKHYHGMMDMEWYKNAIDYVKVRSGVVRFFVFSDDPTWCRNTFVGDEFRVVDANGVGSGAAGPSTEHEDLFLMAQCTHAIIPNSSFGWWGAWLGQDDTRMVVAPKNWFTPGGPASNFGTKDLIPERWTRL
jgi:hypothetical protein